jgi:hypothetical protein
MKDPLGDYSTNIDAERNEIASAAEAINEKPHPSR